MKVGNCFNMFNLFSFDALFYKPNLYCLMMPFLYTIFDQSIGGKQQQRRIHNAMHDLKPDFNSIGIEDYDRTTYSYALWTDYSNFSGDTLQEA